MITLVSWEKWLENRFGFKEDTDLLMELLESMPTYLSEIRGTYHYEQVIALARARREVK